MITPPVEPSSGDRISASWMRSFVRYVRAIRPIAGPGVKSSVTPNGTILSCPKPRSVAKSTDNGCWNIVAGERDGENVRQFGNQFYEDGEHNLNELELEDAVEDFVCQGELEDDEEYTATDRPFVCLKVPATTDSDEDPELNGYKTIEELQEAQKDALYVVKPLYKFTHDGGIKVDFRNCPTLQVAEVLQ